MNPPPIGACDSHIHIYDPSMPTAPTAMGQGPAWAVLSAYLKVQALTGTTRTVVVQPTAYGMNNDGTLAAIAALGHDNTRGAAVIDGTVRPDELARLHAGGICGARFQMLPGGAVPWSEVEPVAAVVAPLNWHLQIQMNGCLLEERAALIRSLPCRVVIDHIGKFLEPITLEHSGFQSLLRLLDTGRVWFKLAAPYETSLSGAPDYADIAVIARAVAQRFPERLLWASNWPHIGIDPLPDEVHLRDLMVGWVPQAARVAMLVDNPAEFYGFPALPYVSAC